MGHINRFLNFQGEKVPIYIVQNGMITSVFRKSKNTAEGLPALSEVSHKEKTIIIFLDIIMKIKVN